MLAVSIAMGLGSGTACSKDPDQDQYVQTPAQSGAGGDPSSGAGGDPNGGAGGDPSDGGATTTGPVRVRVSGSAQKGPIVRGSSVTVYGLDSALEPTGTAFPSQTEDSLGSFDVSANLTEDLIEVVAQGPFYDELTGRLSETSIGLRALAEVVPDTKVRVNLLTTASKARIRYLVGQGQTFNAAVAQAENEVLSAFGIEDDSLDAFTAMDLTGSTASDAALIALSAVLLQYADDQSASEGEKVSRLALAVSTLADDLEEDGVLNDAGLGRGLPTAAVRLDVDAVTANLAKIYEGLGLSLSVPDIQPFVDIVAGPAPWQWARALPETRSGHCACAASDKIYVMGGANGDGLDNVLQYDLTTGQWTSKAKMLLPRAYPECSVVDGKIYVTGGVADGSESATVEAYDPAQDSWTLKAPMPAGRTLHASATIDGKIYVIGGLQETDSVAVYDPSQDAWEPVAPLPRPMSGLASAVVNGKIYTFGGYDADLHGLSSTYEYDPLADTWSPRASMGTPRSTPTAVALGGRIYVISGNDETRPVDTVEEYDPFANTWTTKSSMNSARNSAKGVVLGDLAYVIGGVILVGNNAPNVDLVETYDPLKDVWPR